MTYNFIFFPEIYQITFQIIKALLKLKEKKAILLVDYRFIWIQYIHNNLTDDA